MKKYSLLICFSILAFFLSGQTIIPVIIVQPEGSGYRFSAELPELIPLPGAARRPFYSYFWEFGDGHYSRERSPWHVYKDGVSREVRLYVTNNYAQGQTQPGRHMLPPRFDPNAAPPNYEMAGDLSLLNHQDPVPGDEMVVAVGYRNVLSTPLSGHILLLYNEIESKYQQFRPAGQARAHRMELDQSAFTPSSQLRSLFLLYPQWLSDFQAARAAFRDHRLWRFTSMQPGEIRHLFQSFVPQLELMADTNTTVYMTAYLIPESIGRNVEKVTLEMTVRKSHDPNKMSVRPRLTSFRHIEDRIYQYRVDFQNIGDGAAQTVKIATDFPQGMDRASLRIQSYYPECPICGPEQPTACLDTLFTGDQLQFIFRGISLPGLNSPDIERRKQSKGYVRYTLQPADQIRKKPVKSRTAIYMDQNPPIYTNEANAQFELGNAFGIQAGYAWPPDRPEEQYLFLGATWTPYKPRSPYPILGINTGINTSRRGMEFRREVILNEDIFIDNERTTTCYSDLDNNNEIELTPCYLRTIEQTVEYEQTFLSFDLSAGLRVDPLRWLTLGAGLQYQVQFLNRRERIRESVTEYGVEVGNIPYLSIYQSYENDPYELRIREVRSLPGLFAELGLLQVHDGVSVGSRYIYSLRKERANYWQFFLQYRF